MAPILLPEPRSHTRWPAESRPLVVLRRRSDQPDEWLAERVGGADYPVHQRLPHSAPALVWVDAGWQHTSAGSSPIRPRVAPTWATISPSSARATKDSAGSQASLARSRSSKVDGGDSRV
jgi:hypothetical protein